MIKQTSQTNAKNLAVNAAISLMSVRSFCGYYPWSLALK